MSLLTAQVADLLATSGGCGPSVGIGVGVFIILNLGIRSSILSPLLCIGRIGSWNILGRLVVVLRDAGGIRLKCFLEGTFIRQAIGLVQQRPKLRVTPCHHAKYSTGVVVIRERGCHRLIYKVGFELQSEFFYFLFVSLQTARAVLIDNLDLFQTFGKVHRVLAWWETSACDKQLP